ncbi:MAG: hypothetical protein EBY17_30245, partial [Acidobacteriia bacterium]|nr:hypothetical protein [Terriglobia bacterium]
SVSLSSAAPAARAADAPALELGGYGRVGLSSDLDGGQGRPAQIVPWGPRLAEEGYMELDFGARLYQSGDSAQATRARSLVTLALAGVTLATVVASRPGELHRNPTAPAVQATGSHATSARRWPMTRPPPLTMPT